MKRNGLNQAIAHQMAVMVVDLLEIVQSQEQDAKTLAIVKRLVDFLVDGMAIGQARQGIDCGQLEQFGMRFTLFSDIGTRTHKVAFVGRSEEHTSELQSLMRNSYAVLCLKKKKKK